MNFWPFLNDTLSNESTIIDDYLNTSSSARKRVTVHIDLSYIPVAFFINKYLIPPVCLIGFVGNLLSVAILTRRQCRTTVSALGKSAHSGLIVLALSDMMYCLVFLPNFFWPERFRKKTIIPFHPAKDFWFYQQLYVKAASGLFMTCSTLLTVNVALGRYIAVCYPLKARQFLGRIKTKCAILGFVIFAVLLDLPRFFARKGARFGRFYWISGTEFLFTNTFRYLEYTHAIIGLFIPVTLLLFCNVKLSQALFRSNLLRRHTIRGQHACAQTRGPSTHHVLTLTLIVIICVYLLGVAPSSLLDFVTDVITNTSTDRNAGYYKLITNIRIASAILSLGEAISLSSNFALHCAVNVYFRRVLKKCFKRIVCLHSATTTRPKRGSNSTRSSKI